MPLHPNRSLLVATLLAIWSFVPATAYAGINIDELKSKAEKGERGAQFVLGYCYYSGKDMPKDFVQAVSWYRKAADQGLPHAQVSLGNCYELGEGVAKDYAEAFAWYKKAANQGLDLGQTALGLCYAKGWGVEKDEVEAYAYYNLAGITHEPARKALLALEQKMSSKSVLAGQTRTKVLQKENEAKRGVK